MSKTGWLLLFALLDTFATARGHPENWLEVRTPRFTIVTNTSEKQGRRIAFQFERMRAIFRQAYPELGDDPESPVIVLAVTSKDQFRALEPSLYVSTRALPLHGMFVRASEKDYILMRLDTEAGNPYPVVYHEYTHVFLRQADEQLPLWLNEGFAEFYQNSEIYGKKVLLGEPNQEHLTFLGQQKLLPLSTLFSVNEKSPYYLDEKKGAIFHAECWALTHYLMLKDYVEKTSAVPEYIGLVNQHIDPVTAAIRVFGDLSKLQENLQTYLDRRTFDHFEMKMYDKIDGSGFHVQRLSPAGARAIEAEYLEASGRLEEARALSPPLGASPVVPVENLEFVPSRGETQAQDKPLTNLEPEAPCPLTEILRTAGERATEMVDNLQRFTATEEIEQTDLKGNRKRRQSTNRLFTYVAEIEQGSSGAFWVEEYRSGKTQGDASQFSDTGTAAFALIFHPYEIGNFEFHCEGQTQFRGTPAWLLVFEEKSDPSKSFHQIRINHSVHQLRFKGRAWLTREDEQILRLQTDLIGPIPEIGLRMEHLDIAYAAVEFEKQRLRLWLPASASIQMSYRGHLYQRLHKFTQFQLFSVDTEQTVKEPAPPPGR